jgi:Choline dehydrogenase and related flavoproteins
MAVGAEFFSQGESYEVKTKKEVILSAGVVHSPQILELSGIGGRDLLTKHGIEVLVDNPAVGENLQDHTAVPLVYVRGLPLFYISFRKSILIHILGSH